MRKTFIKIMFLMLTYNYCCHPGIFKLTVLAKKEEKTCKADFFLINMPNYMFFVFMRVGLIHCLSTGSPNVSLYSCVLFVALSLVD